MNILDEELCKIVASALNVETATISIETSSEDCLEWDSLGHMSILSALDEKFVGITLECPELGGATSVKEIADFCNTWKPAN